MHKGRLEAFSDGMIAIFITIMVLEFKVPHGDGLAALKPLAAPFACYVLSFLYLGIYWNNHHHLLQAATHVDGRVLWANLHLLFWLSLVPFTTGWMAENHFAPVATAVYGGVLLGAAVAYYVLTRALLARHGRDGLLAQAIGRDVKGKLSLVLYAIGIAASCAWTPLACALYVLVAVIWLIPDSRIERRMGASS